MVIAVMSIVSFRTVVLYSITTILLLLIPCIGFCQSLKTSGSDSLRIQFDGRIAELAPEKLVALAVDLMASNPNKALELSKLAAKKAKQNKNHYLYSDAVKLQADALYYLDSLQASLEAYLMCTKIDEAAGEPRRDSLLRRYGDSGHVLYLLGRFDEAIKYHTIALKMSTERNDRAEVATNYSNLGINYQMKGDYTQSIDCFLKTLELDKLAGNTINTSTTYNSIGLVYLAWGKHDKALEFLQLALNTDRANGEEEKVAIRLSNLSRVYVATLKYKQAANALEEALEIDRRLKNTAKVAVRLQGLGLVYKMMNETGKALTYYNDALEIYHSLQMDFKIAGLMLQIGVLHEMEGKSGEAEVAFRKGLLLAQNLKMRPEEKDANWQLYLLLKKQGKFSEALGFHERFKSIHDSLFSENSARQISEFEVKYETEKKAHENSLLVKENEIHQRTNRFSMITILMLIILSGALWWALILKRKSLKQSKILFTHEAELAALKVDAVEKQNLHLQEMLFAEEEIRRLQTASLEQKNHELTTAAMLIATKNEAFEKLRGLAQKMRSGLPAAKHDEVKTIMGEIDKQTDIESQWNQFKIHFESIHTSFFGNLRKHDTRVTQNDLQLCAYIRLNLSTKEISRLMNIAPESVNTHRYRLKKKFQLDADVSLDEYLSTL